LVLTTGISSLFLAIVAGVVTYAVAVRALRALHPRDADRLRTLCGVFPVGIRAAAERVIGLLAPEQTGDAALLAATQHRSAGDAG
jgi:hypothetical protein